MLLQEASDAEMLLFQWNVILERQEAQLGAELLFLIYTTTEGCSPLQAPLHLHIESYFYSQSFINK